MTATLSNEDLLADLVAATEETFTCRGGKKAIFDAEHKERRLIMAVLARMSPGWQPIASAPKDGKDILAISLVDEAAVISWDAHNRAWYEQNSVFFPVYWQPISPAPSPSQQGEKA